MAGNTNKLQIIVKKMPIANNKPMLAVPAWELNVKLEKLHKVVNEL